MSDNSKSMGGSCLTATTTIVVASIGAAATIIAALIGLYKMSPAAGPDHSPPATVSHSSAAPTAGSQTQPASTTSSAAPTTSAAPSLEGSYTPQHQNIWQLAHPTQMTIAKASDNVFNWQINLTNNLTGQTSSVRGELVKDSAEWTMSYQGANEWGLSSSGGGTVSVILSQNILTITDSGGKEMVWRKR